MWGEHSCSPLFSSRRPPIGDTFITLARVLKTQGRHGEVAVALETSHPDRFAPGMRLSALGTDNRRRDVEIEGLWPHKGNLVLKLKGVDSMNDAETFLRCELQIPLAERAPLEQGAAYISDLVGCEVFDRETKIGAVTAVQFGAGDAPLLIVEDGEREHLVPFAEEFLDGGAAAVDVAQKRIRMHLPEGLLEMNLPLKAGKKDAAR